MACVLLAARKQTVLNVLQNYETCNMSDARNGQGVRFE